MTTWTFAHVDGHTEVHVVGCGAAAAKTHDLRDHDLTVDQLRDMARNPDEGDLRFHRCTGINRQAIARWRKAKMEAIG